MYVCIYIYMYIYICIYIYVYLCIYVYIYEYDIYIYVNKHHVYMIYVFNHELCAHKRFSMKRGTLLGWLRLWGMGPCPAFEGDYHGGFWADRWPEELFLPYLRANQAMTNPPNCISLMSFPIQHDIFYSCSILALDGQRAVAGVISAMP